MIFSKPIFINLLALTTYQSFLGGFASGIVSQLGRENCYWLLSNAMQFYQKLIRNFIEERRENWYDAAAEKAMNFIWEKMPKAMHYFQLIRRKCGHPVGNWCKYCLLNRNIHIQHTKHKSNHNCGLSDTESILWSIKLKTFQNFVSLSYLKLINESSLNLSASLNHFEEFQCVFSVF